MRLTWADHSILVFLSGISVMACELPDVRGLVNEEHFVQGATMMNTDTFNYDDRSPRVENFNVGGQMQSRAFTQNIQSTNQAFDQVSTFLFNTTTDFTQVRVPISWGIVDILLLIDNSPSMYVEQQTLAAHFSTFLDHLGTADWRIAVATSDPAEYGTIRGMIVKNQYASRSDEMAAFETLIEVGATGPTNERHILNTIGVLLENPQSFIRPNAAFVTVFLADEDSCSTGYNNILDFPGNPRQGHFPAICRSDWDTPQALIDVATEVKGGPEAFGFYGLIWIPGTQPQLGGTINEGNLLQELATRTNRFTRSLWSSDYSQVLADIGGDIPDPRDTAFSLPHVPNANGLQVYVNGVLEDPSHYTISGADIIFLPDFIPPSLAAIHVSYTVGDSPVSTYTLAHHAIPTTLEITVNGVRSTAFTYNQTNQTITFTQVPPASAHVTMAYSILPDTVVRDFNIGTSQVMSQFTSVTVGNRVLSPSDYRFESGVVHVNSNIEYTDTVTVAFALTSSFTTRFNLASQPLGDVTTSLSATYDRALNAISIDSSSIREVNQSLSASYQIRSGDSRVFTLARNPLASSLSIRVNGSAIEAHRYSISGHTVTFVGERLPAQGTVETTYIEDRPLPREFVIDPSREVTTVLGVSLDGQVLAETEWEYNAGLRTIVLDTAPQALAELTVYFR